MNIVKHNWDWLGSLTKVSAHPGVVWHHADGYGNPEAIHSYHQHLKPPDLGIAYHYYVRLNGEIHAGRPLGTRGAHCYMHNDWVGVCAEGRYEQNNPMPAKQLRALQELHDWLYKQARVGKADKPHRDMPDNATACPGKHYPYAKITSGVPTEPARIELTDKNVTVPRMHKPGRAGWWNHGLVPYIERLRDQGDGKRVDTVRPDDRIAIPVPKYRPSWWAKMMLWRRSQLLNCHGRAISGTTKESLTSTLPDVRLLGETPVVDDPGVVTVTAPFLACDKGDGSAAVTVEHVTGEGAA